MDHFINSCNKYTGTRELYWWIIVNILLWLSVNISVYLYNLPENELTEVILGRRPDLEISDDQWQALLATCAKCWQMLCYEPTLNFLLIPALNFHYFLDSEAHAL